jgi:hypothetical protein
MKYWLIFLIVLVFLIIPEFSAAHFIIGYANDAKDGTNSNDHTVILWNNVNGINDNLTDVIGVNGNSNVNQAYMIDCELLNNGCSVGDILSLKIIDGGDGYISRVFNITITGAGFDFLNLTLNSLPNISFIRVDDSLSSPIQQIDLIAGATRNVVCSAIVEELDGQDLLNASARFFDNTISGYGLSDDNNSHYTNNSCYLNASYGNENETEILCAFESWYYSNSGNWNCTIETYDNLSTSNRADNLTNVNTLLSIGIFSNADFGEVDTEGISQEVILNVSNYGNVLINLSLSGYAQNINDGNAMNCTGGNVSIDYLKYNLTTNNPVVGDLTDFESKYENLTASPKIREFNLNFRQNEAINEAFNSTYWRIYLPLDISGDCQGNIVFGATQGVAEV